jgi:hypothetical protein
MAGRHRRVERRGRVWLINFGVLGLALDALLTPMAGGAEGAPRLLFLFWSVVVMMRTVPRWRSRAAQTCKWLGGACAAWFMATMNLGLPNGQLFLSTTFENEAIATLGNGATPTESMGDLYGGLGVDPQAGRGWCAEAAGGSTARH